MNANVANKDVRELSANELDAVSGGFLWIGVVVGAFALGTAIREGLDGDGFVAQSRRMDTWRQGIPAGYGAARSGKKAATKSSKAATKPGKNGKAAKAKAPKKAGASARR